jgi:hypothetical protein
MVRLGPYKQVFEAHRDSFGKSSYSENQSSVLAQVVVGRSLLSELLKQKAAYLETSVRQTRPMLEDEFAERALETLHSLISEFPFLTPGDRSMHVACILTAIQTRVICVCPMPRHGSLAQQDGKSLLAECSRGEGA